MALPMLGVFNTLLKVGASKGRRLAPAPAYSHRVHIAPLANRPLG